jgi:hypothetical protein
MICCRWDHFNGITVNRIREKADGSSQLLMLLQNYNPYGQTLVREYLKL